MNYLMNKIDLFYLNLLLLEILFLIIDFSFFQDQKTNHRYLNLDKKKIIHLSMPFIFYIHHIVFI